MLYVTSSGPSDVWKISENLNKKKQLELLYKESLAKCDQLCYLQGCWLFSQSIVTVMAVKIYGLCIFLFQLLYWGVIQVVGRLMNPYLPIKEDKTDYILDLDLFWLKTR